MLIQPAKLSLLGVVVGFEWPNDPESYAGSNIATGKVSHAGQVKGDPYKKA